MPTLITVYLLIINAVGFLLMLSDKQKAKKKMWRIPETTLLTVAAIGGSAGSYLGMKIAHHKTRHRKFTFWVPVFMCLHICLIFTAFF